MTSSIVEVRVPDLGDYQDVEIIEVMAQAGDAVAVDAPLLTLETEKATMDVPSPVAGVIREVKVQRGGRVSKGDVIALVEAAQVAAAPPAAAPVAAEPKAPPANEATRPAAAAAPPPPAPPPAVAPVLPAAGAAEDFGFSRSHASPSIRRLARELGVDLAQVRGTGPKGRILDGDVKAWVKQALAQRAASPGPALPAVPLVDFAAFGPVERRPLSRIQKISGPRLHASWLNIPHVTQFDEADVTALNALRKQLAPSYEQQGARLTVTVFMLKALADTLKKHPIFNSSLDEATNEIVFKEYIHIGIAVDTEQGLIVPVLRDADKKPMLQIATELETLAKKARERKVTGEELRGGTFTVSNQGGIGGAHFTPIINKPEVAILGIGRGALKPVVHDGKIEPRLMVPLALSYDHRVIDGGQAARFITDFVAAVEKGGVAE